MSFTPQAGHKFKFYRNTATVSSPTWSLIAEIGDLAIDDLKMGVAELKRRANDWTKGLPTLIQMTTISFRLHFGLDQTTFDALRTAILAGTPIQVAIMSGAIATAGTVGWKFPVLFTDFPWNQALEEVSGHDVKACIAYMVESSTEVEPEWTTITTTTTSDRRLKENIKAVGSFLGLTVYRFNYIGSKLPRFGFMAQEAFKLYPAAVVVGGDDPIKNPWRIDYSKLFRLAGVVAA